MKMRSLFIALIVFIGLLSCQKDESVLKTGTQMDLKAAQKPAPKVKCGAFTDTRDNRLYSAVLIGKQCWMTENLAYLPLVSPPAEGSGTNPYYYVYGYDGSNVNDAQAAGNYGTYGALYNWLAANTACPSGWHLPTTVEWETLTNYLTKKGLGYEGSGGDIGKSMASTSGWDLSTVAGQVGNDQATNNASGFSALPGGIRGDNGGFFNLGGYTSFWSSTLEGTGASFRTLSYDQDGMGWYGSVSLSGGFSVRCLKNL